jgi:hypothetical protein
VKCIEPKIIQSKQRKSTQARAGSLCFQLERIGITYKFAISAFNKGHIALYHSTSKIEEAEISPEGNLTSAASLAFTSEDR